MNVLLRGALAALVFAALARPRNADASTVTATWLRGRIEPASVTWHAVYALENAPTIAGPTLASRDAMRDEDLSFELAYPLEDGATIDPSPAFVPMVRNGRIVGITLTKPLALPGRVQLTVHDPVALRLGDAHLRPPFAQGSATQIVEVTGDSELRFEPDAHGELTHHIGYFATSSRAASTRAESELLVGYPGRAPQSQPMYIEASASVVARGGIDGKLSSMRNRTQSGVVGLSVAFIVIVGLLVFGYRMLARVAKAEAADAALDAEFARLDEDASRLHDTR